MRGFLTILAFLTIVGLYFFPAIIGRKKKNASAILALNFFLGWSIIGWVAALVWAMAKEDLNLKKVKAEAQVCRFCGYNFPPGAGGEPVMPPPAFKKIDSEVGNLATDYINRMSKKR
jgi:hypothetical protein